MRNISLVLTLLKRRFLLMLLTSCLISCSTSSNFAPVVELKWNTQDSATHIVRKGETLYAIAFRYDKDFRLLAVYNRIGYPYIVRVGQRIKIPTSARNVRSNYIPPKRISNLRSAYKHPSQKVATNISQYWTWPAKGRVVSTFLPQQGKKGIDIAGKKGDFVKAAASGVVAYAGSGLSGYGNLIIIKHKGQFLTAYGNNLSNRVREGQAVKAGQIIADMGIVERKFWGVHFEIRKSGQPVNPLSYLRR